MADYLIQLNEELKHNEDAPANFEDKHLLALFGDMFLGKMSRYDAILIMSWLRADLFYSQEPTKSNATDSWGFNCDGGRYYGA